MTHEQKRDYLARCFQIASRRVPNPGESGVDPRAYANFVAGEIRRTRAEDPARPTVIPESLILEIASDLERGDFDQDIAGWMGYA